MFTDEKRGRVSDELRRLDHQLFAHILTPDLFWQPARRSGLRLARAPLTLVNLVWLAVSAARHPEESFASLLGLPLKALQDQEGFPASELHTFLDRAKRRRRPQARHDPRGGAPEGVSAQAFSQARQRMPSAFWVALVILLGEQFDPPH